MPGYAAVGVRAEVPAPEPTVLATSVLSVFPSLIAAPSCKDHRKAPERRWAESGSGPGGPDPADQTKGGGHHGWRVRTPASRAAAPVVLTVGSRPGRLGGACWGTCQDCSWGRSQALSPTTRCWLPGAAHVSWSNLLSRPTPPRPTFGPLHILSSSTMWNALVIEFPPTPLFIHHEHPGPGGADSCPTPWGGLLPDLPPLADTH